MKLLMIFGDAAVGKMTVGQELCKITDMRLFHNHIAIEPVMEVFGYFNRKAITRIREVYIEEILASEMYGLITTGMFTFDVPSAWDSIGDFCNRFIERGAQVYCAELVAPQEVRLQRDSTENRLLHKPSKRDSERAHQLLISADTEHRFVSNDGELPGSLPLDGYIKIDNSELPPDVVAQMIKERFKL